MYCKSVDIYKLVPIDNNNKEDSIIKLLNSININNSNKENITIICDIICIAGNNKNADELLDYLIYILTEKFNIYEIINIIFNICKNIQKENIPCTQKEYYCLIVMASICKYCQETYYNENYIIYHVNNYIIKCKNFIKKILVYIY